MGLHTQGILGSNHRMAPCRRALVLAAIAGAVVAPPPVPLLVLKSSRTGSTWLTAELNAAPGVSVIEEALKQGLLAMLQRQMRKKLHLANVSAWSEVRARAALSRTRRGAALTSRAPSLSFSRRARSLPFRGLWARRTI